MRAVFGVVSLLLVLAVIALLAKTQLRAVKAVAAPGPAASATPAEASRQLQQQVLRDINAAAQDGAARNDAAERAEK